MNGWLGKNGPYLIAEIGGNHEGDFNYAIKLTELACKSGVDAVKFQIYSNKSLVNPVLDPDRYQHFKKYQLKPEQYIQLAKICEKEGVTFCASVWDINSLEWIDPYMQWYKIGSGDLTAYPIIKKIASLQKPIMISSGLSTLDEVKQAVHYLHSLDSYYKNRIGLAVLQCTSMYPIPDNETNLSVLALLQEEFDAAIGYSNHTIGPVAVETAIAMGVDILEIHFTDTREGKSFRDHKISYTCEEIQSLIKKIKLIKTLQGEAIKKPTDSEIENNHVISFRRAVFPAKDLPTGTILTEDNLLVLRPMIGISAVDYDKLLGKKLKKEVKAFQQLNWDYIA
jgi:N,N'-diacetyllegionaminate synthase